MEQKAIKVLCADDHPVVLEGLRSLLSAQIDIEVVAVASNGTEAVEFFRLHRPDVTVLDLRMPGASGLDAITQIRRIQADARILMLTTYQGDEDIYRALQAGAVTYLLKETLAEDLVRVVRQVHSGARPVPPEVAARLASRISQPELTRREIDVLQLLAKGHRNKEVAAELGICEETAQVHVRNILAKLKVHDRTQAVTLAIQRGILHLD